MCCLLYDLLDLQLHFAWSEIPKIIDKQLYLTSSVFLIHSICKHAPLLFSRIYDSCTLLCSHASQITYINKEKKTSRTEAAEWLHSAMKMWSIAGKEVNMKIDFDLLSCPNWDTKILLGLIHCTCSLHSRCNWTSVSNIREAAPRSFFWASMNSTN